MTSKGLRDLLMILDLSDVVLSDLLKVSIEAAKLIKEAIKEKLKLAED